MNSFFKSMIIMLAVLAPVAGAGARRVCLTLDDAVARARVHSVDAAVALDRLRTAYWEWRTYRADQLPEVALQASLPSYADRYSSYMNAEGQYSFVRNRYMEAQSQLSVTQNIRLTGGKISVLSSLDFIRQFGSGNRYMSVPFAVTFQQPLFCANGMRWRSRIEPVRYAEAKAEFMSATEDVALRAVGLYFALLLSTENAAIASQNLDTAQKLYAVAKEKRRMGSISQNDLLQMEYNVLDAQSRLTECRSTVKSDMFCLRSFLNLDDDAEIQTVVPDSVPDVSIDYGEALELAKANNKIAAHQRRRRLEADYEVARAKGGSER